ncbi:cation:proton antiporter [Lentilactobacillus sp. SPB1-3]|uniref:Cation:proton antiporter n=1 Tax=Lentilactobacillus terminaliae TaxID=3003483 RepID=A0ACD5DD37_9LACO|nr:sodium:proton antiporter [Lentilactobacillus sp. SPB1-3]MCZ0977968.1 sodium:proton antiporter [Lentilactobacillus sp. SPB1-3]
MESLYLIGLLLLGVIAANVVKQFIPRVPDAFIFITMGLLLSFTPAFNGFELEPEFFMLVIIAPLMFVDGQRQSFRKIRQKFSTIFLLSVVLIIGTILIVGILTNLVETQWTLPLAIALVAVVTPTDAVAVKSLTSDNGREMPGGVGDVLELESLFNDATGLVMLDLALSVLQKGSFSLFTGLSHFLFVSIGGVVLGIVLGLIIVGVRVWLNVHINNAETSIIPISIMTPFLVYIVAEQLGTSGILAVVATGIVHNWEASRLRLTSTRVQLTSSTIWTTISNVLNSLVFVILGLSLPEVWKDFVKIGVPGSMQLLGLSILIYLAMLAIRFIWAIREGQGDIRSLFGTAGNAPHRQNARIFALGGVHGTMTLAMAFSLPHLIDGKVFPFREELILVATLVILISMLSSAIMLPRVMPKGTAAYSADDIAHVRSKMVDYATLQIRSQISDHAVREELTSQLQTQKGWTISSVTDDKFQTLLDDTKDYIRNYIHSDAVGDKYGTEVINIYDNAINHWNSGLKNKRTFKHELHVLKKQYKHAKWHIVNGVVTPKQRQRSREQFKATKSPEEWAKWKNIRGAVIALNNEVLEQTDTYLDGILKSRLEAFQSDNTYVYDVRQAVNEYLNRISHEYKQKSVNVDSDLYIQAFQFEYNFVQQASSTGRLPRTLISALYSEINQAQALQLHQLEELSTINTEDQELATSQIENN